MIRLELLKKLLPLRPRCRVMGFQTTCQLWGVEIKMPALSPTMKTGTIVKWMKREGEEVTPGDVLCEIQTDKAVVSLEVDEEGTLAKILVPQDTADVEIGTLIALLAESGEDWKSLSSAATPATGAAKSDISSDVASESGQKSKEPATAVSGHEAKGIGPAVKMLLNQYGLNKADVLPSGPHGVLLKGDILRHIGKHNLSPKVSEAPSAQKFPSQPVQTTIPEALPGSSEQAYIDIPLTNMRKTIAKRLTQSKQEIPHAYATAEMCMSSVLNMRKSLKETGTNVSVNDFIIKASAYALRCVPGVNVRMDGEEIEYQASVDISVAVATESGLITPIVYSADVLGLEQISGKVRELAEKAKQNKLQPNEFMGGTFTVSNLGMFGISEFTAIINPPQAAILAIGGSYDVLSTDLKPEPRMRVTLCFDNRAISDDTAAEFLRAFSEGIEDPEKILLGGNFSHMSDSEDLKLSLALL